MVFSPRDLSDLRIAILGGGQLGWMMILEGRRYPLTFYVVDNFDAPACTIAHKCFDFSNYKSAIDSADVVTYEFEHVPYEALRYADEKEKLVPRIDAVELKRERWRERVFYKNIGVPTPRFFITESFEEALQLVRTEFDYRAVIKQSTGGYDGKGQFFIKCKEDFEKVRDSIAKIHDVFIVEEFIDFDYEASVVLVRDSKGNVYTYPPTHNLNTKGILIYNYGPLENVEISKKIVDIATKIAEKLNYVGVMAVEFFIKNSDAIVNEFAPRVHNTGHYTLDAANISQFEQHIKTVTGLEATKPELLSSGGTVNILGIPFNKIPLEILKIGKVYWYGKKEVRKRRKMGHINIVDTTTKNVKNKIETVMSLLYPDGIENYV